MLSPICAFSSNVLAQQVVQNIAWGQMVDNTSCCGQYLVNRETSLHNAIHIFQVCLRSNLRRVLASSWRLPEMYRIDDDEQFALDFLKQEKSPSCPWSVFNWKDPDHFGIVYLPRNRASAQIQKTDASCANHCGYIIISHKPFKTNSS